MWIMPDVNARSADGAIIGVRWGRIAAREDDRGAFREVWRRARADLGGEEADHRIVQANLSFSRVGVLRGLHIHLRQQDYWVVADGEIFLALVDVRDAGARPATETRILTTDDTVAIPSGIAHGYLALRPTTMLYFVTREYDGSDEYGLAWDDPELRLSWPAPATPDRSPILSERDRTHGSFADTRRLLRRDRPSSA
jgi:dTDP-4-dehydrorhamnose 3,5-epimerase